MIKPLKLLCRCLNKQDEPAYSKTIDSIICRGVRYFFWLSIGVACLGFIIYLSFLFVSPKSSKEFAQILLFSLGLIGASATFAISIWRGEQIDEQIDKAQKQIEKAQEQIDKTQEQANVAREQVREAQKQVEQTRFQNAIQMATEKKNAGRCAAGLRILARIYDETDNHEDRQTINTVALYVLSKNYAPSEKGKPQGKEEFKTARTARQWALDILVRRGFLSHEASKDYEENKNEENDGMDISISDSTVEKDFSRLNFTRKLKNKNECLNLSDFSFRNCNFFGANLSNINFSGADFADANIISVDLTQAVLTNAKGLTKAQLSWAYYSGKDGEEPIDVPGKISILSWQKWRTLILRTYSYKREERPNNLPSDEEWGYMKRFADRNEDYPAGKSNP